MPLVHLTAALCHAFFVGVAPHALQTTIRRCVAPLFIAAAEQQPLAAHASSEDWVSLLAVLAYHVLLVQTRYCISLPHSSDQCRSLAGMQEACTMLLAHGITSRQPERFLEGLIVLQLCGHTTSMMLLDWHARMASAPTAGVRSIYPAVLQRVMGGLQQARGARLTTASQLADVLHMRIVLLMYAAVLGVRFDTHLLPAAVAGGDTLSVDDGHSLPAPLFVSPRHASSGSSDSRGSHSSGERSSTSSIVTVSPGPTSAHVRMEHPSAAAAAVVHRQPSDDRMDIDMPAASSANSASSAPASPSADVFRAPGGSSCFDGESELHLPTAASTPRTQHVLLVVTTYDPFASWVSIGEQALNKRGLAELLLDNPTLAEWALCEDSSQSTDQLKQWMESSGRDNSLSLTAHAAMRAAHQCEVPLGEFKHMYLHLLMRLKERAESSGVHFNLRVSIVHWDALKIPLNQLLTRPHDSSSKAVEPNSSRTAKAWVPFCSDRFETMHVRPAAASLYRRDPTRAAKASTKPRGSVKLAEAPSGRHNSKFAIRFLPDLSALAGLPVDAVHLPSLMWYSALATQAELKTALGQLLINLGPADTPASLYPPLLWDDLCEQKEKVYEQFHAYMIPCRWRSLDVTSSAAAAAAAGPHELSSAAAKLAKKMQADVRIPPAGAVPNSFMLKAAWGYGKTCVHRIDFASADEELQRASLARELNKCAYSYQQRTFTLQPFHQSLTSREYRIWCVAADLLPAACVGGAAAVSSSSSSPGPASVRAPPPRLPPGALSSRKRWRISVGLVSCFVEGAKVAAEVVSEVDPETCAVWQFVRDLLRGEHRTFFDRLLDAGMPAVRIDCFYSAGASAIAAAAAAAGVTASGAAGPGSDVAPRVLLNEITPPQDTMMFTHAHHLPMMRFIMRALADGLFARLA